MKYWHHKSQSYKELQVPKPRVFYCSELGYWMVDYPDDQLQEWCRTWKVAIQFALAWIPRASFLESLVED